MKKHELQEKVQKLVDEWQVRLNLQNWQIYITMAKLGDSAMSVAWAPNYQKVLMSVNYEVQQPQYEFSDTTIESNVVHELVHLLLAPIRNLMYIEFEEDGQMWQRFSNAQEEAVENLTAIIVRAKYASAT